MEKITIFFTKHVALVGRPIPGSKKLRLINVVQNDYTNDENIKQLKEQYEGFYDEVEIRDMRGEDPRHLDEKGR